MFDFTFWTWILTPDVYVAHCTKRARLKRQQTRKNVYSCSQIAVTFHKRFTYVSSEVSCRENWTWNNKQTLILRQLHNTCSGWDRCLVLSHWYYNYYCRVVELVQVHVHHHHWDYGSVLAVLGKQPRQGWIAKLILSEKLIQGWSPRSFPPMCKNLYLKWKMSPLAMATRNALKKPVNSPLESLVAEVGHALIKMDLMAKGNILPPDA